MLCKRLEREERVKSYQNSNTSKLESYSLGVSNAALFKIGKIVMFKITTWISKDKIESLTIPEEYRPYTTIDIPFTSMSNKETTSPLYLEIRQSGVIEYTGQESILVNAMWFTK